MASKFLTILLHIIPLFYALCSFAYPTSDMDKRSGSTFVNMAYLQNSAVYESGFSLDNYDFSKITHILYAFANVDASSGTVSLSDAWADTQIVLSGESSASGVLNGLLGALFEKKLQYPNLKVLLSIGGANAATAMASLTNSASQANFVSSAIQLLEDCGLDGIDVDWETPTADNTAEFTSLLSQLRSALTSHAQSKGDTVPYQLTFAAPAGDWNVQILQMSQINQYVDYVNIMAYDFSGSWSSIVCPSANLIGPECAGVAGTDTISTYLNEQTSMSKIVLGIPVYGHIFENTGGMYGSFNGVGANTVPYSDLPYSGAQVTENTGSGFAYSYDSSKQELVSYDTINIVNLKANYMAQNDGAGVMFWDLSQDGTGSNSLVSAAGSTLGSLDQTPNHQNYPGSQYTNVKNAGSGSSSSSQPSSTPTSTPTSSSSTGICAGVAAWSSSAVYASASQQVTYNGDMWENAWWTQGDIPTNSASYGPWLNEGSC